MYSKDKILNKIAERTIISDNCHIYKNMLDPDGYGRVYAGITDGKKIVLSVHRFIYEYYNKAIPKGRVVMHSCDNPSCCNPSHLSVGTHAENVKDAINKERHFSTAIKHVLGGYCSKGHLLTKDTLIQWNYKTRIKNVCRICTNEKASRNYQKRKLAKQTKTIQL